MSTNTSEYDFTLLLDQNEITEELENALFEAGCDDALISLQYGRVSAVFSREASDLASAILDAVRQVCRAGCKVRRVDSCNLVTQAEIASRVKLSRQTIHHYIRGKRGQGGFPPPACYIDDDSRSTLWNWCEVASWFHKNGLIREEQLRDALALDLINNWLEIEKAKSIDIAEAKRIFDSLTSSECGCD